MRRRLIHACVLGGTTGLQLTDTYHSLLKAVPRPPPLTTALPMCYSSPLTDAHKALRPAAAQDVRTSCALFAAKATADEAPKRRACLASLWLAYGMLDECHALVVAESYSGSDAAYVHALLHRKEGAFVGEFSMTGWANSKYWWGVLGAHPLFEAVAVAAADVPREPSPLLDAWRLDGWDPYAFVDLCAAAHASNDETAMAYCRAVAEVEWDLLHGHILAGLEG